MDIAADIKQILESPDATITKEWLDATLKEYPYFALPLLLFLKRNSSHIDNVEHRDVLARIAIMTPDRTALFDAVGDDAARFVDFYPPDAEPATPDTDTTITSFLDRFGNNDEKEIEVLNQLIFNPTPDYSSILAAEEQQSTPTEAEISGNDVSPADALINRFIAQSKEKMGHFPATVVENPVSAEAPAETMPSGCIQEPETSDDSTFSESLAKIYIKQGKYSKALEIIKNISLKFPEKSVYFADQIRFLKKLIINEQIKNKK